MSHVPNELDIKTDLRRSIMASFSKQKFADPNFKTFIGNSQKNLDLLKESIGKRKYLEVKDRINKSFETKKPIEKRREDLLTAASLL